MLFLYIQYVFRFHFLLLCSLLLFTISQTHSFFPFALSLTHSLSFSLALSLTYNHCFSLTHSLSLSYTFSHSHSLLPSPTLSHMHTLSHPLASTHSFALTLSLVHFLTHPLLNTFLSPTFHLVLSLSHSLLNIIMLIIYSRAHFLFQSPNSHSLSRLFTHAISLTHTLSLILSLS